MCIVICPLFSVVSDVSDSVCGHRCGQKYPPPHGSIEPVEEDFYVLDCNLGIQGCQAKESTSKNAFDYIELEDYNNAEKIVSGG